MKSLTWGVLVAAAMALVSLTSAGAGTGSLGAFLTPIPHAAGSTLDSRLSSLATAARAHGSAEALASAKAESLAVSNGRVRVIVQATTGQLASAKAAIAAAGGVVEEHAEGLVEALVAPSALQRL